MTADDVPPDGVSEAEWADILTAAQRVADESPPLSQEQMNAIALLAPSAGGDRRDAA